MRDYALIGSAGVPHPRLSTVGRLTGMDRPTFSLWIIDKPLQAINEICPIERITPNADADGLPQSSLSGLIHSLVSQRATPTHYTCRATPQEQVFFTAVTRE